MKLLPVLLCVLLLPCCAIGQSKRQSAPSLPSQEEITELTLKAAESLHFLREETANARADFPGISRESFAAIDNAANGADQLVSAIKKNGPTGASIFSLVSTIDDLNLDVAKLQTFLVLESVRPEPSQSERNKMTADLVGLASASKNLYDIGELIFHAGFRLIAVEDQILANIVNGKPAEATKKTNSK